MVNYLMVSAEHCSSSPLAAGNYSSMTYESLFQAFRLANEGNLDGVFVGPGPRVTRAPADPCLVRTTVSWLLQIPEVPPGMPLVEVEDTIRRDLRSRLGRTLQTAQSVGGDWLPATVTSYDPALHGGVDFWTSGTASNTRTRNGVDLGDEENRVGPNDAPGFQRRVTPVDFLAKHKVLLIGVGAAVGVSVLAYGAMKLGFFGPLFSGAPPQWQPPYTPPQNYFPPSNPRHSGPMLPQTFDRTPKRPLRIGTK